ILVDPTRADDITNALIRLETDETFLQQQKSWGLRRAQLFSWRKTTEQLLELYQEVMREKGEVISDE
ncbi:MAG: hypothetical protein IJ544_02925, partial [Prevotella sp.]|nr:hypothetical protein [Prevotella sp.]